MLEKLDNLIEVTQANRRDGSGSGEDLVAGEDLAYTDLGGAMGSNEKEMKGGGEGKGK